MRIQMRCVEPGHKGDVWAIDFANGVAKVLGPQGQELVTLTPGEAANVFELPDYVARKYFGLRQGAQVVRFKVPPEGMEQIGAFLNVGVVISGPEAVRAMQTRALRDTAIGVVLMALGIGATVLSFQNAASHEGAKGQTVYWGAVVVGLVALANGIRGFARYASLSRAQG